MHACVHTPACCIQEYGKFIYIDSDYQVMSYLFLIVWCDAGVLESYRVGVEWCCNHLVLEWCNDVAVLD